MMLRNSPATANDRVSINSLRYPSTNFKLQLKLIVHVFTEMGTATKAKDNIYSMHVNNLMELTTQDPDPYFFGSYNWYYTGGTMETASIFDVDFLFYASGEKLNVFSEYRL